MNRSDMMLVKIADLEAELQAVQKAKVEAEEQLTEVELEVAGLRIRVHDLTQKVEEAAKEREQREREVELRLSEDREALKGRLNEKKIIFFNITKTLSR